MRRACCAQGQLLAFLHALQVLCHCPTNSAVPSAAMLHMASVARPVPAAGAHAGTRREAARLPAPPPQRVRQRATAAAAAPRRHERRRLEVAACHRCLQQTQRQLIPRLQQHGSRGPGGPNVLKEGSAARAADTAADAAQRAPAPPERQQQAGQKQQQPGQQGQQEDTAGVRAALTALRFYKAAISPLLPPACRFLPTCSGAECDGCVVGGRVGAALWAGLGVV